MSIQSRIFTIIGTIILLIGGITLYVYNQTKNVDNAINNQITVFEFLNISKQYELMFLNIESLTFEYLSTNNDEILTDFNQRLAYLENVKIKLNHNIPSEINQNYKEIFDKVDQFKNKFNMAQNKNQNLKNSFIEITKIYGHLTQYLNNNPVLLQKYLIHVSNVYENIRIFQENKNTKNIDEAVKIIDNIIQYNHDTQYNNILNDLKKNINDYKKAMISKNTMILLVDSISSTISKQLSEIHSNYNNIIQNKNTTTLHVVKEFQIDIMMANILIMILLVMSSILIRQSIVPPINKITHNLDMLAKGDLNFTTNKQSKKNEMSIMNNSLHYLKEYVSEVYRSKQVIHDMPVGIMLAKKENFEIIIANDEVKKIITPLQEKFDFDVNNLEGMNIDKFHNNPEHIRKLLENPNNLPYNTIIEINTSNNQYHILKLTVSAVMNNDNSYYGPMVIWEDITDIHKMKLNFEKNVVDIVQKLMFTFNDFEKLIENMNDNSHKTSIESNKVMLSSSNTSQNIQTVASAIEELNSSITEIAQQVQLQSNNASNALMLNDNVSEKINSLLNANTKAKDITLIIREISEKINMLALNASIEAARAGKAGAGFSVVASEVKSLANKTQQAIDDVNNELIEISNAINSVVDAVNNMSSNITIMNEISTSIASAVQEQNAATHEISRNMSEASIASANVTESISIVGDVSHKTNQMSNDVIDKTKKLSDDLQSLQISVQNFIKQIS